MKWDINHLENLYQNIDSVDPSKLTEDELYDKNVLAELINCYYNKNKHEIDLNQNPIIDLNALCNVPNEFVELIKKTAFDMESGIMHDYIRVGKGIPNRIKEEDYLQLVIDFLKNNYPDIYQTFIDLKQKNKILLQPRRINKTTSLGCVFSLANFKELYTVAYFNKSFVYSSVLLHELSHAEFMQKDVSIEEKQKYIYSLFSEAAPRYIELVYAKYLIDKGYICEGQRIIHDILDSFICRFDYNYNVIYNAKPETIQRSKNTKLFISEIMSMHLFAEYLDNPDKGNELYNKLLEDISHKSDFEIFQENNLIDSKNNLYKIYSYYLDEIYSNSRKRQIKNRRIFL